MNFEVGKTTKAEVVETFGAPNITTRDGDGNEAWTYQRQAQVNQSSSNRFIFVIIAGKSSSVSGFSHPQE